MDFITLYINMIVHVHKHTQVIEIVLSSVGIANFRMTFSL